MAEAKAERKARTIGVNFPRDPDWDFVYEALVVTKEDEDRSLSRVAGRIIREYFESTTDEFQQRVRDRLEAKRQDPDFNL